MGMKMEMEMETTERKERKEGVWIIDSEFGS
jgi:hypothetical protein